MRLEKFSPPAAASLVATADEVRAQKDPVNVEVHRVSMFAGSRAARPLRFASNIPVRTFPKDSTDESSRQRNTTSGDEPGKVHK